MWASRDDDDARGMKWRGNLIDLGLGSVIARFEESHHLDWGAFVKELISGETFDAGDGARWKFGAVHGNQNVDLPDFDTGEQSADGWKVWCGDGSSTVMRRIDCALRSAHQAAVPAAPSLGFDTNVESIAAGWIPREAGGLQRAVVVCMLHVSSYPAIMHFYPTED